MCFSIYDGKIKKSQPSGRENAPIASSQKNKLADALRALQIDSILWQRMSSSSLAQAQESLQ
jgi:hypothetical protein